MRCQINEVQIIEVLLYSFTRLQLYAVYHYSASSPVTVKRKSSPTALSPKVKVVHRQIIIESHPAVQQLVDEYEYDLEASIEAVRLCRGDVNKAMDYLARKDAEDGENMIAEFESMLEAPNEGYV